MSLSDTRKGDTVALARAKHADGNLMDKSDNVNKSDRQNPINKSDKQSPTYKSDKQIQQTNPKQSPINRSTNKSENKLR